MVQRASHQVHWWHAAIAWPSIVARHSRVIHVARSKSECCVCVWVGGWVGGWGGEGGIMLS